jgi:hypothetical protein
LALQAPWLADLRTVAVLRPMAVTGLDGVLSVYPTVELAVRG